MVEKRYGSVEAIFLAAHAGECDPHIERACLETGLTADKITPEQRTFYKMLNFQTLYSLPGKEA